MRNSMSATLHWGIGALGHWGLSQNLNMGHHQHFYNLYNLFIFTSFYLYHFLGRVLILKMVIKMR